jgi:X-X-X-Leu-X-X-Gly heptad repeat protein
MGARILPLKLGFSRVQVIPARLHSGVSRLHSGMTRLSSGPSRFELGVSRLERWRGQLALEWLARLR